MSTSTIQRDYPTMVCREVVALSGYIFFGSAVQLGERISALAATLDANTDAAINHFERFSTPAPAKGPAAPRSALTAALDMHTPGSSPRKREGKAASRGSGAHSVECVAGSDVQQRLAAAGLACAAAPAALRGAQRFLLVDFSTISGLDATAAATFKKMSMSCAMKGVVMVLTGIPQPCTTADYSSDDGSQPCYKTFRLLAGNDVVAADHAPSSDHSFVSGFCPCFSSLDDALAWCESYFLKVRHTLPCNPSCPFACTAVIITL